VVFLLCYPLENKVPFNLNLYINWQAEAHSEPAVVGVCSGEKKKGKQTNTIKRNL